MLCRFDTVDTLRFMMYNIHEVIELVINGKRVKSNIYFRKIYQTWRNMMQRCYNPSNPYFKNYGGKGITVAERWHDFDAFVEDFDKIKGFSEAVFTDKHIMLDKDGAGLFGSIYSLESCEFIDINESNKRKQHQMRPFRVVNMNTNEVRIYTNQSECAKDLNIRQSGISYTLTKGNGKYKGYMFEFIDRCSVTTIESTQKCGSE